MAGEFLDPEPIRGTAHPSYNANPAGLPGSAGPVTTASCARPRSGVTGAGAADRPRVDSRMSAGLAREPSAEVPTRRLVAGGHRKRHRPVDFRPGGGRAEPHDRRKSDTQHDAIVDGRGVTAGDGPRPAPTGTTASGWCRCSTRCQDGPPAAGRRPVPAVRIGGAELNPPDRRHPTPDEPKLPGPNLEPAPDRPADRAVAICCVRPNAHTLVSLLASVK
jgi:hypothetical protein